MLVDRGSRLNSRAVSYFKNRVDDDDVVLTKQNLNLLNMLHQLNIESDDDDVVLTKQNLNMLHQLDIETPIDGQMW